MFYHTPHEKIRDEKNADITFVNINKNIIGMASGRLDPSRLNDVLILSAQNTLIAYGPLWKSLNILIFVLFLQDVINNSDLFYKDVQDGISSIHFGVCNNKPLVYIGGNCAIQVFNFYRYRQYAILFRDSINQGKSVIGMFQGTTFPQSL